jgi:hypothetical protein
MLTVMTPADRTEFTGFSALGRVSPGTVCAFRQIC